MKLTTASQKFILHWGEMGQAWGINRTMAQVHALLFVSPEPLDAEQISQLLDVSRSNVSTSLKELTTWGVVKKVHIIGDLHAKANRKSDVVATSGDDGGTTSSSLSLGSALFRGRQLQSLKAINSESSGR